MVGRERGWWEGRGDGGRGEGTNKFYPSNDPAVTLLVGQDFLFPTPCLTVE